MNSPQTRRAGLLALSFLISTAAFAGSVGKANPDVRASARSWTPERFAQARALPMPETDFAAADLATDVDAAPAGAPGFAVGHAPVAGIRADSSSRLFDPSDPALAAAGDADRFGSVSEPASGSAGGYFTSARLVPTTADRSYPYSTVGKLFFHIPGKGDFYCSAAVIRVRIVATAAQCLHSGNNNPGFYEDFQFVPAYRDGSAPLGTWDWNFVSVPSTWANGNGKLPSAADYGLLELLDQSISGQTRKVGEVTGYLGYQVSRLRPNHAHLLGYPSNFDGGGKLHQVTAQALRAAANNNVEYGSDMRGGSGGGPLIQDFGDNPALARWIGALSYFNTSTAVKVEGASIPDSRFTSLIKSICAHKPGNC
jgi:V8-like Glu-specific endopeptidase